MRTKDNKLTIQINKPVSEVFNFLLNPKNTPLWIDSIVKEVTNEWPVKVGSKYRNQNKEGVWSEYMVLSLDPNNSFEFIKSDNNYHVRYTLISTDNNKTKLEYYEWVKDGEIDGAFTQDILEKLKSVLESLHS